MTPTSRSTEIARRINEELVATWGNLVNRVLSMVHKNLGEVPSSAGRTAEDDSLLATVDAHLVAAGEAIERVELRNALRHGLDAAQAANAYLNATEPWKLQKSDPERASVVLGTALEAINGVRVALSPFLPFTCAQLDEILGAPTGWQRTELVAGTPIGPPSPLFAKIDLDALGDD